MLDDPSIATFVRQLVGWPMLPGEEEEQLRREQNQFLFDVGERDPKKFQKPTLAPRKPNTPQQRDKAIRQFDRLKQERGLRPDRTPRQNQQVQDPSVPLEVADPKRYGKRGA
jgi:hypothetical protein